MWCRTHSSCEPRGTTPVLHVLTKVTGMEVRSRSCNEDSAPRPRFESDLGRTQMQIVETIILTESRSFQGSRHVSLTRPRTFIPRSVTGTRVRLRSPLIFRATLCSSRSTAFSVIPNSLNSMLRIATSGMHMVFKGRREDSGSTPASLLRTSAMESP